MRTTDIELTPPEQEYLSKISFGSSQHDEIRASIMPMVALYESLKKRDAIPEVRRLYFTDPERNPGARGKSRLQVFEGNGTSELEVAAHQNFMRHLEYFVYGPNLPESVIARFKEASKFSGYLTIGDAVDLIPEARAAVRSFGLNPYEASEEFYKLVLECGGMPSSGDSIRKAVRSVKDSSK